MTRGESVFEVSRAIGLDDTSGTDELILMQRWWNRGIVDVLLRTHCFVDLGSLVLQAGVTDYRIDATVLAVDDITVPDDSGNPQMLDVVDMTDILRYLQTASVPGNPTRASIEGSFLRVAPAPSTAITLTYLFVPRPTVIAADGTTTLDSTDPSNVVYGGVPTEYHEAILYFMLWKASEYDDKQAALSPQDYRKAYEALCADVRRQHRRKAGRGLHRGHVGYPTRLGGSSRNDVYPNPSR